MQVDFGGFKFFVQFSVITAEYEAALWRYSPSGPRWFFDWKAGDWKQPEENGRATPDAILTLNQGALQAMADGLAQLGIYAKGRRFDNEMDLMKSHLQDMRALAFEGRSILPADLNPVPIENRVTRA